MLRLKVLIITHAAVVNPETNTAFELFHEFAIEPTAIVHTTQDTETQSSCKAKEAGLSLLESLAYLSHLQQG